MTSELQQDRDCRTLRAITGGVEALERRMEAARERLGARERGFFLPDEDDEVKRIFLSYRNYRIALYEIIARHQDFAEIDDEEEQARSFLLAFGAAVMLYNWSGILVRHYRDVPLVRAKLNEPDKRFGIEADLFEQICEGLTKIENLRRLHEASLHFARHRALFRDKIAAGSADFAWLIEEARQHYGVVKQNWREILTERLQVEFESLSRQGLAPLKTVAARLKAWALDVAGGIWLDAIPSIPAPHMSRLRELMQPGDIFIVRPERKSSTVFLPGWWTHGAFYLGGREALAGIGADALGPVQRAWPELGETADGHELCVIEALAAGVITNPLARALTVDHALALRPRLNAEELAGAIGAAFGHLGKEYDFDFDLTRSDRLVCTEVIYRSFHGRGPIRFAPVARYGRPTISADDIVAYMLANYEDEQRPFDLVALSLKDVERGESEFLTGAAALAALKQEGRS